MLKLIRNEPQEDGSILYWFGGDEGYEFSVKKPNQKWIDKLRKIEHPIGEHYLKDLSSGKGLDWEINTRWVVDSTLEQVAEGYYKKERKEKDEKTKELIDAMSQNISDVIIMNRNIQELLIQKKSKKWDIF